MFELDYKNILGIITIALAIYGFYDYIIDTIRGKTTPHLFSWIAFFIMDVITFLVQIGDNAGPGARGTLVTGLMVLFVIILALRNGEKNITKSDIVSFSLALMSIVFYVLVENPIYSLIMVICILIFAMYPTFRKSYYKPEEETLSLYFIAAVRSVISIVGLMVKSVWLGNS